MTDKREISELRSAEHELRSAEQAEALWEHRMLHGTDPEPTAGVLHEEDWGTGTRTTIGPKDATMHTYVIEGTVTRAHVVWGRFEVKALTEEHARIVFEEAGGTGEQDLLAVATEIQGEDMEQGLDDPYEIDSIKEVD
jgi:hypothetical protein